MNKDLLVGLKLVFARFLPKKRQIYAIFLLKF
jgi:hypothetical protein